MRILPGLLRKAIKKGSLTLVSPDGSRETFGEPGRPADVVVRINDASLDWKIPLNPELKGAEAYMDGSLEILEGDVYDFLKAFYVNRRQFDMSAGQIFWSGNVCRADILERVVAQIKAGAAKQFPCPGQRARQTSLRPQR